MGRRGLVDPADGLIQQLSPVLQRGIIGAVQPFAHDRPLSFTINILLQNGASGSPVFSIDTGEVLGVAFQRRFEPTNGAILDEEGHEVLTADGKKMRTVVGMPTNYSFVVPTYRIAGELPKLRDDFLEKSGDQQISFKDYYNGRSRVDMTTGEVIKNIQSIGPNHYIVKRSDIE